jgi:acrylyl-CoA reductase (NADPH)
MHEGSVVSTGLVASPQLNATVYPFILNGINLLGIGSADTSAEIREMLWQKLLNEWSIKEKLHVIVKEASLDEINNTYIDSMLDGKVMGRIIVKI